MSEEDDRYEEEDYVEDEEGEYTGLMALLYDEKKEPHLHLAILLTITFIVAVIVYVAGF